MTTSNSSSRHFFRIFEEKQVITKNDPPETKLAWLRTQIIGGNVEFNTPFEKRLLTDVRAAARSLLYIEDFITNQVLPFYGNTHTSDSFVGQKTTKMVKEATRYIKTCLGAGPNDALIFCGNDTTAAIKRLQEVIGMVVPSTMRDRVIQSLPNEQRWVVFLGSGDEHHSSLLSWRNSLAEVIEIGHDENGLVDMRALRQKLEFYKDLNRPMLGSFSACSSVTGISSDTNAIACLLHQYGAFACFDYTTSGPFVEIDMRSGELEGHDAIFLNPHKFLGGLEAPGILLMHKALYQLGSSAPSTSGGGTVGFVNGFTEEQTLYYEDVEEREDAGTPPIIQKLRAALAFWVKDFIGYNVIKTKNHFHISAALERLLPNPNISVLGNTSVPRQAIMSFVIFSRTNSSSLNMIAENGTHGRDGRGKPLHGSFIAKLLSDLFGIQASPAPYGHHLLGFDEAQSLALLSAIQKGYNGVKPGLTSLSFPYYMSKEEFEFILAAVEFIVTHGQRFLPLYSFDWKVGNWTFKSRAFIENILGENYPADDSRNFSFREAIPGLRIISNGSSRDGRTDNIDEEALGNTGKYAQYLETAKYVASFLPSFPPQRSLPKDLDPNLVYFRV